MRGEIELALNNLEAVLSVAGMGFADVIKLGFYTTDADAALKNFDLFGMRFGAVHATPPMILLEVSRLALPGLMFEIEAAAAQ